MVDRPFRESRPVGPFMDINLDEALGEKVQFGVSGTTMPNLRKSPMNILFVLDKHVATLPKDIRGTLRDKITDKLRGTPGLAVKRGGSSAKAPFDEQAIVVTLKSDNLPVQDAQIHKIANAIERHYSDFGVGVKTVIMDTE